MKKIAGLILLTAFVFSCKKEHAPATPPPPPVLSADSLHAKWTDLTTNDSAVYGAVSYSVDGKGYVLGGSNLYYSFDAYPATSIPDVQGGGDLSRFRQYDPSTGNWDTLPRFPVGNRRNAAGFSIGNSIYIATGEDDLGRLLSDCWKFDIGAKTWTRVQDLPADGRNLAVGFALNGKGYIATGVGWTGLYKDVYQYDPVADTWKKMADFPGVGRCGSISFSIGDKAYIGLGGTNSAGTLNDLWQFDASANTWSKKASRPDTTFTQEDRSSYWVGALYSTAFVIKDKGYVGFGYKQFSEGPSEICMGNMYQYDPVADHWQAMPSRKGVASAQGFAFVLQDKAYVGGGYNTTIPRSRARIFNVDTVLSTFSIDY